MFTLNTFAVAVRYPQAGWVVVAKCHNRVTAEYLQKRMSAKLPDVSVLAPGAVCAIDDSADLTWQAVAAGRSVRSLLKI